MEPHSRSELNWSRLIALAASVIPFTFVTASVRTHVGVVRRPKVIFSNISSREEAARTTVAAMEQVRGFKLDADGGERLRFSDAEFIVKVSADSTGGAFTIIEEVDPLDTPLHVHENENELWYILEGEHIIRIGDAEFRARPGDTVFGPRGVPHAQGRVKPRTGRFLAFFAPAGFEGFFRELAEAERTGSSMSEAYVRVSEKYGITWLNQ
jgi:mannose-6-phosphate isomerase-like protein (cupin superfamily)